MTITLKVSDKTKEQMIEGYKRLVAMGVEEFGIHSFLVSNAVTNDYYPMAICHYYPENMSVNQQSTNVTDNSDNNYTNNWAITSTGVSGDYQLDENVVYICN